MSEPETTVDPFAAINPDLESALAEDSAADAAEWDLTHAERQHYEEIKRLNKAVATAQRIYDRKKADAKFAKDDLEELSVELSDLITSGPSMPDLQQHLPFPELGTESPEAKVDPDAWKSTPITDVLKLTTAQREKLEAAGITTVGRLEMVRGGQDPDFPRGLRSIKGFGERTVDAIENDVVEWLSKNLREA